MTDSNLPAWTYHRTKWRTDISLVAGATAAIFATLMTMVVLHDQLELAPKAALLTAAVSLGLMLLTSLSREVMRRSGIVPADRKRYPQLLLFAISFVPSLLISGAISREPIESGIAYQEGLKALESGQYADASKAFSRYIEIHPTRATGYFWRGKAEYQNGQLLEAYKDVKTAMRLHPSDVKSQVLLIGTLQKLGLKRELRAQLIDIEQSNPNIRFQIDSMLDEVAG